MFDKLFPLQFDDQGYVISVCRHIGPLCINEDRYGTSLTVKTVSLFGRIISPIRYFGWRTHPKVHTA